jgi:hypothetical protein
MPLRHFGLSLRTYAEAGDRSYLHHLWVYVFDFTVRTERLS